MSGMPEGEEKAPDVSFYLLSSCLPGTLWATTLVFAAAFFFSIGVYGALERVFS